jgi:hypothetical protein
MPLLGIDLSGDNVYNIPVIGCMLLSGRATNGFGIAAAGIYDCTVQGYSDGYRLVGFGAVLSGSRVEVCDNGVVVGKTGAGAQVIQCSGFVIEGLQTESCALTQIDLLSAAAGKIDACVLTANIPPPNACQRALRIRGSQGIVFSGTSVSGQYSVGGIDMEGGGNGSISFLDCIVNCVQGAGLGPAWINMPTGPWWKMPFVKGTNGVTGQAPNLATTIGALGGAGAPEHDGPFLVTDAESTAFRALVNGGGSNRALVRANGAGRWMVVG